MPRSSHNPHEWVGEEKIIGEAVIRTDLPRVKHVSLTLKESNLVPNEEAIVLWYPYEAVPGAFVIRVEKGGTNSGVLGTNEVTVTYRAYAE